MRVNRLAAVLLAGMAAWQLAGCDAFRGFGRWASQRWETLRYDRGWIGRGEAGQWLISNDPDERQKGVSILHRKGLEGLPVTREYIRTLAQHDANPVVRGAAVRAMRDDQTPEAAEVLRKALSDPDAYVRAEACIVLGERADPAAIDPLIKTLDADASADVRAAAAASLAEFLRKDAALALAKNVADEEFLVGYSCLEALRQMTGEDLGFDAGRWSEWIAAQADPFAKAGQTPPGPRKPEETLGSRLRRVLLFWRADPRDVAE